MSDFREAAQLALEVLRQWVIPRAGIGTDRYKEAISLLRAALAQPDDKAQPVAEVYRGHYGGRNGNVGFDGVRPLRGAKLPQPGTKLYAAPQPPAEHGDDVHDAETELNCAEEVLDAIAVGLDMEETAFDCIGDYITAVVNTIMKPAMRGAQFTDADLEPPEQLAGRLIDAWCATHGKQIPWAKAVEISAIITKMPDSERERLLNLE